MVQWAQMSYILYLPAPIGLEGSTMPSMVADKIISLKSERKFFILFLLRLWTRLWTPLFLFSMPMS